MTNFPSSTCSCNSGPDLSKVLGLLSGPDVTRSALKQVHQPWVAVCMPVVRVVRVFLSQHLKEDRADDGYFIFCWMYWGHAICDIGMKALKSNNTVQVRLRKDWKNRNCWLKIGSSRNVHFIMRRTWMSVLNFLTLSIHLKKWQMLTTQSHLYNDQEMNKLSKLHHLGTMNLSFPNPFNSWGIWP